MNVKTELKIVYALLLVAMLSFKVAHGETLNLVPGENRLEARDYTITAIIRPPSNCKIIGVPGKTRLLTTVADNGKSIEIRGDNVSITGCIIEGGGIFIDRTAQPTQNYNSGIVIDNNEFRLMIGSGDYRNGISFTVGLKDSKITNNLFTGESANYAVYGYNYDNLTVANNEVIPVPSLNMLACRAGFHIDGFPPSRALLEEQNLIIGVCGMGVENQSDPDDVTVQDNWYENPRLFADRSRNLNTMAYSVIVARGKNIKVRRNYGYSVDRPDGEGARDFIECGGDNAMVEDNYGVGFLNILANNDGEGSSSVTVRNNHFEKMINGPYTAYGQTYTGSVPANPAQRWTLLTGKNDNTVQPSWLSRGKPGRNHRFGDPPPTQPIDANITLNPDGSVQGRWQIRP